MSKEAWKEAKAEFETIDAERDDLMMAAAETIRERWEAAQAKLDKIEAESPERIGTCEGCLEHIWKGDLHSYDSVNSLYFCERCSPTYGQMLAEPWSFHDNDGEPLSPEQARAIVDAHVAAGGALYDKMVSV